MSPEIIESYFNNLKATVKDVLPENIINYDETNLTDDLGTQKVICERGAKRVQPIMDSSKQKTVYNRSSSGWFDGPILVDWFKKIIIPHWENTKGVKCLIGDNLASHLSMEVLELCEKHSITALFLAPLKHAPATTTGC